MTLNATKRSKIVSSLVVILILPILIPSSLASIKANPPVYDDYYLPQIVKYSGELLVNVDSDSNGEQLWSVSILADVQFKIHRNSVAQVQFYHRFVGNTNATCTIFNNYESLPGPFGGNLVTAGDLITRQKQGDWYLETHKIEIPVLKNSYKRPCVGNYEFSSFVMIDTIGNIKQITIEPSNRELFYAALNVTSAEVAMNRRKESFLPEYSCPKLNVYNEYTYPPLACLDIVFKDYKVGIDSDKLDKAAADKAAADARAAALKKTTIICVKGKITKKVTAIKPKCPSGYKVKK